jgi:hypothetical protein
MENGTGAPRNVTIKPAAPVDRERGFVPAIGAEQTPSIHVTVVGGAVQVQPAQPAAVPAAPPPAKVR